MAQIELTFVVKAGKAENNEEGGEVLRDDRSKRNAGNVKVEDDDEEHIAGYVYGSREHKEVERTLRVSLGTQKRGAVVIDHLRGHTEEDDTHIKCGVVEDLERRVHKYEKRLTGYESENADHYSEYRGDRDGGMNDVACLVLLTRSERMREGYRRADRKTYEKSRDQVGKRARGCHGCKSRFAVGGKVRDDEGIGGVI